MREELAINLTKFAVAKNLSYILVFIYSLEYLGFNPGAVIIFLTLMVIDVITGVARAGIVQGGQSVTSALLVYGIWRKILTLLGLFSFALTSLGVGFDLGAPLSAVVTIFIVSELYSILGNIYSSLTREPKMEFDAVRFLFNLVGEALRKVTQIKG